MYLAKSLEGRKKDIPGDKITILRENQKTVY